LDPDIDEEASSQTGAKKKNNRSRGTGADFERLVELGVELEGKIALIRYGSIFRGLKVKNAQNHGMIGAVIFTDPADDGNMTVANGVEPYPRMLRFPGNPVP
jgi:N-acetylated-alpha-linked acidic dipeptidase